MPVRDLFPPFFFFLESFPFSQADGRITVFITPSSLFPSQRSWPSALGKLSPRHRCLFPRPCCTSSPPRIDSFRWQTLVIARRLAASFGNDLHLAAITQPSHPPAVSPLEIEASFSRMGAPPLSFASFKISLFRSSLWKETSLPTCCSQPPGS